MKVKFEKLLKENYYKTLSMISLTIGFSLTSYLGLCVRDIIFGKNDSIVNLGLGFLLLGFGIIFIVMAVFFNFKIDQAKGVKKYDYAGLYPEKIPFLVKYYEENDN